MKNGRVVKGVHFVDIKEAGDPVENAAFYQAEGADELAMLDIAATLENRKTRLEWVKKVSGRVEHSADGRRRHFLVWKILKWCWRRSDQGVHE
ncbi:MAG: HisA/HisF-related TIM barrel protein, partial [Desulfobacterales bacterium]|nr:HisA/HisF-related TIM barrel protein [Desulfobacterales bacterium]